MFFFLFANSSLCSFQIASYRRNNFCQPSNWVRRRGGGYDENLSAENKAFLDQVVIDKYKIAESPLKDGPWKKGAFNPDGVYVIILFI